MNDQADAIADVLDAVEPMPNNHVEQAMREALTKNDVQSIVETSTTTIIEVLPGIIVRPGDVLVIESADYVTSEHVDRIKAEVFKRMPCVRDVVVLQHVRLVGVYREGEAP